VPAGWAVMFPPLSATVPQLTAVLLLAADTTVYTVDVGARRPFRLAARPVCTVATGVWAVASRRTVMYPRALTAETGR
jgi:hypothetical protein